MSSFAPAYQHAHSDAWLNDIVGDIVSRTPSRRSSSLSRRSNSFRSWHTAHYYPQTGDSDGSDAPSPFTANNCPAGDQEVSGGLKRSGSGPGTSAECPDNIGSADISKTRHPPLYALSQTSHSSARSSSRRFTSGTRSPMHSRTPSNKSPKAQQKPELETDNGDRSILSTLDRRLSVVPEFTGFDSHPAVRPLEHRRALGDAAGPDTGNTSTEYPGPWALIPVVLGICLSVFIISLDRNIITTVRTADPKLE